MRFSSTESEAKTERPSVSWVRPRRVISNAGRPVMSRPSNRIVPRVVGTSPDTTRATVDLPAPFAPTSASARPARTSSDTSKSAS